MSRANVSVKYERRRGDRREDVVGIERHVLLMRRYHQPVSFLFFSFLLVFLVSTSKENLNGILAVSNVLQILYERRFIVPSTILSMVRVHKISRDEKLVRSTDRKRSARNPQ